MLCAKQSSKLGTVEAEEERLSITCSRKTTNQLESRRLRARTEKNESAREMYQKHDEPDGEHNANSNVGKVTLHLLFIT